MPPCGRQAQFRMDTARYRMLAVTAVPERTTGHSLGAAMVDGIATGAQRASFHDDCMVAAGYVEQAQR
jgi:hypothetical protein